MNLRVRLIGIGMPGLIKTIHRCTLLNARELNHLLPMEQLRELFPLSNGINFNFQERGKIIIQPEPKIITHLDGSPMYPDQHYPLALGDSKIISINNELLFRAHVFSSYF